MTKKQTRKHIQNDYNGIYHLKTPKTPVSTANSKEKQKKLIGNNKIIVLITGIKL